MPHCFYLFEKDNEILLFWRYGAIIARRNDDAIQIPEKITHQYFHGGMHVGLCNDQQRT